MKKLNLYAGAGGNRAGWEPDPVVSIERDPELCKIYATHFPQDTIYPVCAHEFLKENFSEFDFIWSSPPCFSHSRSPKWAGHTAVYPDLRLYEEILFLRHYFKGLWVVENVIPYYQTLIPPTAIIGRHCLWSNFRIGPLETSSESITDGKISDFENQSGISIHDYKGKQRKDKILRSCVHPEIASHILSCAKGRKEKECGPQLKMKLF